VEAVPSVECLGGREAQESYALVAGLTVGLVVADSHAEQSPEGGALFRWFPSWGQSSWRGIFGFCDSGPVSGAGGAALNTMRVTARRRCTAA
jgi:hypothetical protein